MQREIVYLERPRRIVLDCVGDVCGGLLRQVVGVTFSLHHDEAEQKNKSHHRHAGQQANSQGELCANAEHDRAKEEMRVFIAPIH